MLIIDIDLVILILLFLWIILLQQDSIKRYWYMYTCTGVPIPFCSFLLDTWVVGTRQDKQIPGVEKLIANCVVL